MTRLLQMWFKWKEWFLNDIFPLCFSFLVIPKWARNDRMMRNEGDFLGQQKIGFWKTCHPTIIPSFQNHSGQLLRFMEWHRNEVRMRSEWNKRLLSLIKRQHPFISFRPHSTHSWIILSFKYHCLFVWNWHWHSYFLNDLRMRQNEVRMK